jgi:putative transposase
VVIDDVQDLDVGAVQEVPVGDVGLPSLIRHRRVILTPVRAPKANAFAEQFARTIRSELLDLTLVTGRRHLPRLLADYEAHYNSHRPHRGIGLAAPQPADVVAAAVPIDEIRRARVVDDLISEYRGRAA